MKLWGKNYTFQLILSPYTHSVYLLSVFINRNLTLSFFFNFKIQAVYTGINYLKNYIVVRSLIYSLTME